MTITPWELAGCACLVVVTLYCVYYMGYYSGLKTGGKVVFDKVVGAAATHFNAADYWRDRALLAEQKCAMLAVRISMLAPGGDLPPGWVATAQKIIDAKGKARAPVTVHSTKGTGAT